MVALGRIGKTNGLLAPPPGRALPSAPAAGLVVMRGQPWWMGGGNSWRLESLGNLAKGPSNIPFAELDTWDFEIGEVIVSPAP